MTSSSPVSSSTCFCTSSARASGDTGSPGFHPGGGTQNESSTPASRRVAASSAGFPPVSGPRLPRLGHQGLVLAAALLCRRDALQPLPPVGAAAADALLVLVPAPSRNSPAARPLDGGRASARSGRRGVAVAAGVLDAPRGAPTHAGALQGEEQAGTAGRRRAPRGGGRRRLQVEEARGARLRRR